MWGPKPKECSERNPASSAAAGVAPFRSTEDLIRRWRRRSRGRLGRVRLGAVPHAQDTVERGGEGVGTGARRDADAANRLAGRANGLAGRANGRRRLGHRGPSSSWGGEVAGSNLDRVE